jgi:hypothetical protein
MAVKLNGFREPSLTDLLSLICGVNKILSVLSTFMSDVCEFGFGLCEGYAVEQ